MSAKVKKFVTVYAVVLSNGYGEDLVLRPLYTRHKKAAKRANKLNRNESSTWIIYTVEEYEVRL